MDAKFDPLGPRSMRQTLVGLATCLSITFAGVFPQDVLAGGTTSNAELAFNNHCRECHMVDKGDNRVGPSLCGIIGRKAGSMPGFPNYSAALQDSGITWEASSLDKWIADPNAFVPGNNMNPFPA